MIYYDRVLPLNAEQIIKQNYAWLIDYVKKTPELDFQITFNWDKKSPINMTGTSRFSIYRGTSRILSFVFSSSGILISIDAAESYKATCSPANGFFTANGLTQKRFVDYFEQINRNIKKYGKYYITSGGLKNEGFYQNLLNRRYTLNTIDDDDFVIFDREFEFGFSSKIIEQIWNTNASNCIVALRNKAQQNNVLFNNTYSNKSKFDEIDGIGINKHGDLIIIEVKHPRNVEGIAYGPMQVRYYIEQLKKAIGDKSFNPEFYEAIKKIVMQKQRLGILSLPQNWTMPTKLSGKIISYLIVGSMDDSPQLSTPMKNRFHGVKKHFDDKTFQLQVKVCADAGKLDGTLMNYTI